MKKERHFLKIVFWISAALIFNIYIYFLKGERVAVEFFGGYIIEMTLSLDNLFLFLMIFSSFKIPLHYQERVLKYGIFGAIILRLIFISLGISIIKKFHWLLYVFGLILILSGIKMFFNVNNQEENFTENKLVSLFSRMIPVTKNLVGESFFVRKNKRIYATPLFLILLVVESSDILFALDSIPAIFSITTDTLIVFTSNIFAILGLRSMYFILAKMNSRFRYMKYGVTLILIFTGIKLLVLVFDIYISTVVSVLIIMILILSSILVSLIDSPSV